MRAAALSCRSYYSLLRGAVSPERWTQAAAELGYGAAAIADVNALYGAAEFYKAAKARGIKPVIGAEILTDAQRAILLIEDERGYSNLCRVISARNLESDFCLTGELAKGNAGLICIALRPDGAGGLGEVMGKGNIFYGCREEKDISAAKRAGLEPAANATYNMMDNDDIVRMNILSRIRHLSVEGPGCEDHCGLEAMPAELELREQF